MFGAFRGPSLKYFRLPVTFGIFGLTSTAIIFGLPRPAQLRNAHSTAAMATVSPLLIRGRRAAARHPPRHFALPSDAAKLPDGAVPRVSEDDIRPPYASDGGELAQVKRDLRNAMRRADRAEAAAASNKASRATSHDVHGATRREREAPRARAAPPSAGRAGPRAPYDALEEPFLGL